MLDENLPTFRLRPSTDNPLSSILYFSQNGDEPAPEYVLRRADPALPASRNKYAVALCAAHNADVVYGEVMVEPEWSQPTLSAAEIRAQGQAGAAAAAPAVPLVPDSFTVQLYNPDQSVAVKMVPGSWGKSDSWEFELPIQTFPAPTASELDREQQNSSPAAPELIPRIMFRWKKDGLLSKDMTCYMSGKRLGARKSKEPDITVALFKAARESVLTVYQPNLHRVELEDRKGLELVLLLSSEVIRDLWLSPKPDLFNVQGGAGTAVSGNKRKNSRPLASSAAAAVPASMSGALGNAPPPQPAAPSAVAPTAKTDITSPPSNPEIDAETRRLQAMVEQEEREREKAEREREKAERAEQKRIKRMIEEEEKERRRRAAEVAKETERLRKVYGVEGQVLPSEQRPPALPPRGHQQHPHSPHSHSPTSHPAQHHLGPWGAGAGGCAPPAARPVSAGPYSRPVFQPPPSVHPGPGPGAQGPFHFNTLNALWKGAAGQLQKVQKKRSSHW
ncbi:uncharacterized protein THITE_2118428 [Thermothielavioides terrestris NRRL 8126]|uniref:Uncharacterized protein n=1 Tax=Thermothielavioides terrestris (strain ATCC 38088 / NRRL 8126) TaxID=578455 RepID=G2RA03_THETT|nr:uncharacterized protein THITE_2118428 [Thermothielavioides terrestris NRRL 8126]AEO68788.1 hypothetical protein THITE_2118428 [Thermothielavioides terrestris NRRL 8126]